MRRVNPLVFCWIWRKVEYSWEKNRADEVTLFGQVTYNGHGCGASKARLAQAEQRLVGQLHREITLEGSAPKSFATEFTD